MHCDIAVLDDVVVNENAYTEDGRNKVRTQYSLLSSIEGAEAKEWVVGTRYHPKDLYNDMLEMVEVVYDEEGEPTGDEEPIYEIMQREVEDRGDGTGEFLWPRQQREDGKWFGFNQKILATKRGKYVDRMQFSAQYYNRPEDPDTRPNLQFQYFDRNLLSQKSGQWFYRDRRINLVAAIDFAYSTRKNADYTAIVVIGVDFENNIYVLDITRFRTSDIKEYFARILETYNRWGYRKLVAETTAAQQAIVRSLKEDYFALHGLDIKVEEVKPTRHEGTKEERMDAILSPRYQNNQVYHYRGGNTQILEEELSTNTPAHDDIKDALSNAIDFSVKPMSKNALVRKNNIVYHHRFGGIAR
jgi:phage terminase large subunit-like protein